MLKKILAGLLVLVLVTNFLSLPAKALTPTPTPTYLICTSNKKGVAGTTASTVGVYKSYVYNPYSNSFNKVPMLKRGWIAELRRIPDPNADCSYPFTGCRVDRRVETLCCPAKMIKKTIQDRGPGGYWLIFNEPMGEDGCPSVNSCTEDAAFAMSYIKNVDQTAKFIVGWIFRREFINGVEHFDTIASAWPLVINTHHARGEFLNLSNDINQELSFAGWSAHYISARTLETDKNYNIPVTSPGKEIWITEFGSPLGGPDGNHCYYTYLNNSTTAALCIAYMKNLVYGMENSRFVTRYFWWSYASCYQDKTYPGCWAPLANRDDNLVVTGLNELGKAFAAIPNTNGQCWYPPVCPAEYKAQTSDLNAIKAYCKDSTKNGHLNCPNDDYAVPLTCHSGSSAEFVPFGPNCTPAYCECRCNNITASPTPTPTPNYQQKCDLNFDTFVNYTDLEALKSLWYSASNTDINGDGTTNETDLSICLAFWHDNP